MTDWNLLIKGGKGCGKCSGCITVYEDNVRVDGFEDFFHAVQDGCCDVVKGLLVLHDGEIVVGDNVESLQYLIQHSSVLAGDGYDCMEGRTGLEFLYERAHFDGFGAGAENYKDCFYFYLHIHFFTPLFQNIAVSIVISIFLYLFVKHVIVK